MTYIGDSHAYISRNVAILDWQSEDEIKRDHQTPQNATGKKQDDKRAQLQILAPLQEKGRVILRENPQFRREALNHKGYSQTLKPNIFLA